MNYRVVSLTEEIAVEMLAKYSKGLLGCFLSDFMAGGFSLSGLVYTLILFVFTEERYYTDMKNIIVESSNDQNADLVMEMADQLRNEGFHEGFSQGIRYGLKTAITLKFAEHSEELLDMLNQVYDVDKLTRINEAIVFINEKDKLIKILT